MFEYCKAHASECDCIHLNAFRYNREFIKMTCTHPEYIPLTNCWTEFLKCGTQNGLIKAFYDKCKEEFKDDYKKLTELEIATNWMLNLWYSEWTHYGSKDDADEYKTSKLYDELWRDVYGICGDMCEGNPEIAKYHFEMTD